MGAENEHKVVKPKSMSFSDAEIQALVEAKISADTTLTQTEAIRRVFREASGAERIAELEAELVTANKAKEAAEESLSANGQKMDRVIQQRDEHAAASLFGGLPDEAVEYLKGFFAELVDGGHYASPQMFYLDLLRRVQNDTKFFIPDSKQTVKKEWIHQ